MKEQFRDDVDAGLSGEPKSLPSKYFYDKRGDELFAKIMHLPEYYLTRAEHEIFTQQSAALVEAFGVATGSYFELIELGAGDGLKTRTLLLELQRQRCHFEYIPVDISDNVLEELRVALSVEMPSLPVRPEHAEYHQALELLRGSRHPKVVLFLGSSIGNLSDEQASRFLGKVSAQLQPGDKFLLGVDLIKPESVVLPAYDDESGVTRDFNLNLLERINTELGGEFDTTKFSHRPRYDEQEGIAESFLVSEARQQVHIRAIGKTFYFEPGEPIHTEISRKYDDRVIARILRDTQFKILDRKTDSRGFFASYVLARTGSGQA